MGVFVFCCTDVKVKGQRPLHTNPCHSWDHSHFTPTVVLSFHFSASYIFGGGHTFVLVEAKDRCWVFLSCSTLFSDSTDLELSVSTRLDLIVSPNLHCPSLLSFYVDPGDLNSRSSFLQSRHFPPMNHLPPALCITSTEMPIQALCPVLFCFAQQTLPLTYRYSIC